MLLLRPEATLRLVLGKYTCSFNHREANKRMHACTLVAAAAAVVIVLVWWRTTFVLAGL